MIADFAYVLVPIFFGLGIMSLLATTFGALKRGVRHAMVRSVGHGVLFGTGAVLAMLQPVSFGDGILVDARSIIVGFAAAFGGWPAGIVAAAMAGAFRVELGGLGAVAGSTGIVLSAGLGLVWARWFKPEGTVGLKSLVILGLFISLNVATILLLPFPVVLMLLGTAIPPLTAGAVIGSVLMGVMIERERRHTRTELSVETDANTDPLTQIPNRRSFYAAMETALSDQNDRRCQALLVIDVDHFKSVNDRYGHDAGDAALKSIATVVRGLVRAGDHCCRLGGEEFAILLDGTPHLAAGPVAEMLRHRICSTPFRIGETVVPLSVSIGVAIRQGDENGTIAELLREADIALYRAKAGGRNLVAFADEPVFFDVRARAELEAKARERRAHRPTQNLQGDAEARPGRRVAKTS